MKKTLTIYNVVIIQKETGDVLNTFDSQKMPSLYKLMKEYNEDITIIVNKSIKTIELKTEDLIKYGREL